MAAILLVDDDANFRRTLAVALRLEGLGVGEAESCGQARPLLLDRSWELVVVDLLLEDGQALALARAVAGERPDARLALSSTHPELFRSATAALPSALLLAKPFGVGELLAALEEPARAGRPNATPRRRRSPTGAR